MGKTHLFIYSSTLHQASGCLKLVDEFHWELIDFFKLSEMYMLSVRVAQDSHFTDAHKDELSSLGVELEVSDSTFDEEKESEFVLTLRGALPKKSNYRSFFRAIYHANWYISGIINHSSYYSGNHLLQVKIKGDSSRLAELKEDIISLREGTELDIFFQENDEFRKQRKLFVFDMDSTLLRIEVIDELARKMGVVDKVSQITEAAMRGEIDFDESFRRRVKLLKGMKRSVIDELVTEMPLNDGAELMLKALKKAGMKIGILSGGFIYFVEALQKRFGIDYGYANEFEFKDGVATGEVKGEIVNSSMKVKHLKTLTKQEGFMSQHTVAVGDGANDLPMLKEAGMGVAFRAKPVVHKQIDLSIEYGGLDTLLPLVGICL